MNFRQKINEIIEARNETCASSIYDSIMLAAIVIGIIPLMFRGQNWLFWVFDITSGICFIIDYILRWLTADLSSGRKGWKAFVIHPFTPMAIIDLLSILPTLALLSPSFKIVRVSRLLKVLRVIKVVRYYEPLEIILAVIRCQSRILYTVFSLAFFYIFITALIMFNAEEDINPETGVFLFRDFFDAFYWAACTLTTVGYGDLYPISNVGRIVSILSSMVGIAIIALPSGIVTAGYLDELKNRKEKQDDTEENMDKVS